MKQFKNAFLEQKEYNCFACSPNNNFGLQMKFYEDGEDVVSIWEPKKQFDGWEGVVHGGIQATLVDEVGEWYIFTKIGRSAVTLDLSIRYKKPLSSEDGKILLRAQLASYTKSIAEIKINVYDSNNTLCSTAVGKFYVFSEEASKRKFKFPGKDKFYHSS